MNPSDTDEQIIEACRAQSQDWARCFSILIPRYQESLFQYLWRKTRSVHNAEDLTQESFLRAYQKIHLFDPSYKFKTWLYTIATRLCVNQVKKRSPELDNELSSEMVDHSTMFSEDLGIWEKAQKLNEDQYTALLLKYSEDHSIKEIATIMNKSESSVKVLLFRARQELAKTLPQIQPRHSEALT